MLRSLIGFRQSEQSQIRFFFLGEILLLKDIEHDLEQNLSLLVSLLQFVHIFTVFLLSVCGVVAAYFVPNEKAPVQFGSDALYFRIGNGNSFIKKQPKLKIRVQFPSDA